jgi:hypothetical protein
MRVPTVFISKSKSVEKKESAEIHTVTNLNRVRNRIRTSSRGSQLTKF